MDAIVLRTKHPINPKIVGVPHPSCDTFLLKKISLQTQSGTHAFLIKNFETWVFPGS